MRVTVYTKPDCRECDELVRMLERLHPVYGLEISPVNTQEAPATLPVLEIEGGRLGTLQGPVTEELLRAHLETARADYPYPARAASVAHAATSSVLPPATGNEGIMDRVAGYVGRRWLRFVTAILGIFLGVAWLAPVFAALGWWGLADPIYTAYAFT